MICSAQILRSDSVHGDGADAVLQFHFADDTVVSRETGSGADVSFRYSRSKI